MAKAVKFKFKPGEKVELINSDFTLFEDGQIVNITKSLLTRDGKKRYLCCNDEGDCWFILETDLKKINKNKMSTQMKQAVLDTANKLLKAQNTVTTLEIKNQLRQDQPKGFWNQQFISDTMNEYYNQGLFSFTDNGTYRTYSALTPPIQQVVAKSNTTTNPTTPGKPKRISRKKAYELMTNNKGHFFTATFTKQNGEERTINCQYMKGKQDEINLGYIRVKESGKLKAKENAVRQINLQTLKSLKIAGNLYKIR